ncbi:hypothetical protein SDC9_142393 [bioreactor metagenome]|uniref:Uncharacterized protein n=1 Tax=bioreactor metagenome TaxID=1076179 RepID=A0A645E120_9ZZZZ
MQTAFIINLPLNSSVKFLYGVLAKSTVNSLYEDHGKMYTQYPHKKKKHVGLWIALIAVVAIVASAVIILSSLPDFLNPKNLGITYTEENYQSAVNKIGLNITFNGMTSDELREYTKKLKESGEKLNINDYTWEQSDYERKTFTLTSEEATAFLNEVAPAFYWFSNQQIKVGSDGKIEASGTLYLRKAVNELYPELSTKIPFPLFEKVNLYSKGSIHIENNSLTLDTDELEAGLINTISPQMLEDNAGYFNKLYSCVPGLEIYSLNVNEAGEIAVDALIPQKTIITKK